MRKEVLCPRSLESKMAVSKMAVSKMAVSKKAVSSVPSGVNEITEKWKMW